jgi:arsenate reductase
MQRVLILCTGNSCRSQMAESLWQSLGKGEWRADSAGSRPAGYVHPLAIRAMRELGIDISAHSSKSLDQFRDQAFDLVVTVCDNAREACPVFPGAMETLHWPFDDPADATGTEEERLVEFRRVRDEIREKIEDFLNVE